MEITSFNVDCMFYSYHRNVLKDDLKPRESVKITGDTYLIVYFLIKNFFISCIAFSLV